MRVSGSAEIDGYDATPAMSRAQAIIDNASFTFPELKQHLDLKQARVWAGLRARDSIWDPDHRRDEDQRPVDQFRARPSGLDHVLRLGSRHRGAYMRPRPRYPAVAQPFRSDPAIPELA
jgi:hypothetical protein